ncbi:hypothetical protein P9112_004314 [Eukaryota sp. TZLM1-RC]
MDRASLINGLNSHNDNPPSSLRKSNVPSLKENSPPPSVSNPPLAESSPSFGKSNPPKESELSAEKSIASQKESHLLNKESELRTEESPTSQKRSHLPYTERGNHVVDVSELYTYPDNSSELLPCRKKLQQERDESDDEPPHTPNPPNPTPSFPSTERTSQGLYRRKLAKAVEAVTRDFLLDLIANPPEDILDWSDDELLKMAENESERLAGDVDPAECEKVRRDYLAKRWPFLFGEAHGKTLDDVVYESYDQSPNLFKEIG